MPAASRAYLICQLCGWAAYAATGVFITGLFTPMKPALALTEVGACAVALLLSHALRNQILARGWLDLPLRRLLPRLLASAVGVALLVEAGAWAIGMFATHAYTWRATTPSVLIVSGFNWGTTLILWTSVYAGVQYFRRYRLAEIRRLQLEVAARDAQLQVLSARIHPHFFFNALNAVRALISEDPARAREVVTDVAGLMRYSLQAGRRERAPLAEELEAVSAYLQVESARFESRLRWSLDVPEELTRAMLPPMVLQPLVENAVKHGIATLPHGGEVQVRAERRGEELLLTVRNPGALEPGSGGGFGLENVEQQLRLGYGPRAALELEAAAGTVTARLRLPLEYAP